jgi:hypothetical protein
MKKKRLLTILGALSLLSITSFTMVYSNGSEVNLTGSPVDGPGTCSFCHSGGTATVVPSVTASPAFGSGNTFIPGTTYTISIGESGYPYFGFDLEICNKNARVCTDGGTFGSPVKNCQFHTPASRFPTNVTHTGRIPASSTADFEWTAPSSGNAYVYYCLNGVNGDGTNGGDRPHKDSLLLTPSSTTGIFARSVDKHSLNIFPNPASGSVCLSYKLEKRSRVSIELYDLEGKKLAVLFSQTLEAGDQGYTATLPAELSKGVYTIHLLVDDQTIRSKLMIR